VNFNAPPFAVRLFAISLLLVCASTAQLHGQAGGGSETHFEWDGSYKSYLGSSVANAGDINQDGVEDVMIAATWEISAGVGRTGAVYVFSGLDGTQLLKLQGLQDGATFGRSISTAGDMNGDGIPDLAVGAMFSDSGGLNNNGAAFVFSGATGTLLYKWNGHFESSNLGRHVSNAGDLNQDGFDDLLVGERYAEAQGISYG